MFRVPAIVGLILLIAFGLGTGSAIFALRASSGFGSIRLGAWVAFPEQQGPDADPYARAHRASAGRLLYGVGEGLAFIASQDDSGAALDPACTYVISGQTPPARFFTLFAADETMLPLDPGPGLPRAFNSQTVLRKADGSFAISISARAQPWNWLAIRHTSAFRLVFTLLDTPTVGSSGVIDLSMPSLTKTGCDHA